MIDLPVTKDPMPLTSVVSITTGRKSEAEQIRQPAWLSVRQRTLILLVVNGETVGLKLWFSSSIWLWTGTWKPKKSLCMKPFPSSSTTWSNKVYILLFLPTKIASLMSLAITSLAKLFYCDMSFWHWRKCENSQRKVQKFHEGWRNASEQEHKLVKYV